MEMRIERESLSSRQPPAGFDLLPWSSRLSALHAEVKYRSFREEIDSHVFPCLGELEGCQRLMREISGRQDFVPKATWLMVAKGSGERVMQPVGTIQGLRSSAREGAIQNIGVHPDYRGLGLGTQLIQAAIQGFLNSGCRRVHLEVTAQNTAAIRLYERLGFRRVETLFKIAEVQYA
jgi:[ribosomal protein S18]-alanine N-acetyltransferase